MNERHVVVGAGPVGLATAELLAEQGKDVVLVSRSGTGPEIEASPVHCARGGRRRRRRPAGRAGPGRRRDLQLRQPAVVHGVAGVLAAGRRGVPRGRRAERRGAGHGRSALPLRPGRRADGRGPAGRRDDQEGADPRRDVGRGEAAARRGPDQGGRGARLGLHGAEGLDRDRATSPASRRPRSRARRSGSSAAPTSRTRSPTSATWPARWSWSPVSRRHGAGSGTRRPTPPDPVRGPRRRRCLAVGRTIGKVKPMPHVLLSACGRRRPRAARAARDRVPVHRVPTCSTPPTSRSRSGSRRPRGTRCAGPPPRTRWRP